MASKVSVIFAIACVLPTLAAAQTLCDVGRFTRVDEQLEIQFRPEKSFRILRVGGDGRREFTLQKGQSMLTGKDATIFAHDKLERTCVIRVEEREGRQGLYIEELFHVAGQPPSAKAEFIEVY